LHGENVMNTAIPCSTPLELSYVYMWLIGILEMNGNNPVDSTT